MGVLANEICNKMTYFAPGLFLGVGQLVKLVSTQAYLGKVLLQLIAAPLDFPLLGYSPLKMQKKKKIIEVVNLPILALHHRYNFQNFSEKVFFCI